MRTTALLSGIALQAALATHPLAAQGEIRLGLGAGISIPIRSYADAVKRGWHGTANLTFLPSSTGALGLRLDGYYGESAGLGSADRARTAGGTAGLVAALGGRRSPNRLYLFGGAGFFRVRTAFLGGQQVTESKPAISGGAGISFGARAVALFVEARYVNVYTNGPKPQFAPISAGISIGGL
jgi:hypothetical protein